MKKQQGVLSVLDDLNYTTMSRSPVSHPSSNKPYITAIVCLTLRGRRKGISDSLYGYIDRYILWFNREEQSLWPDDPVLNVKKLWTQTVEKAKEIKAQALQKKEQEGS